MTKIIICKKNDFLNYGQNCNENVSIISTVNRILGINLSILWLPLFMHSDTI